MTFKSLLFCAIGFLAMSCHNDDGDYEMITVAEAKFMSKTEFRMSVDIAQPQPIKRAGKIYAYNDYIFVNDLNEGVHILDNSNPRNPIAIKYIKIPGNEDISIKNNFLYADSATDLVVFDLSDMNKIMLVERLEDVFEVYNYHIPFEAQASDFNGFNYETDVIVGWNLKTERREKSEINPGGIWIDFAMDAAFSSAAESTVGIGGSLARFQIVNNYLYTVGPSNMSIFNIQNLANPVHENSQYSRWNIETMFQADGYLYLGSTNGMYIYSLENPEQPMYISEFTHWEGCDPVVVDGDYAYLTLRGGNLCGQDESVLEIIDIKDKFNPTLVKRYTLENPYGLGFIGDKFFICEGDLGLKLYNRTSPTILSFSKTIGSVHATDVIPLPDKLLLIGDNKLTQFKYSSDSRIGLELLSSLRLN